MLDSGLRQIEAVRLKWGDIDYKRNIIKVYGKGDKYSRVPLGNVLKRLLANYKDELPYNSLSTVLLSDDGTPITGNAIKLYMYRIQNKLGFEFCSHKLRHNFGTKYLLDKYEQTDHFDINGLKALMGHVSTTTTELYIHIVYDIIAARDAPSHLDKIFL